MHCTLRPIYDEPLVIELSKNVLLRACRVHRHTNWHEHTTYAVKPHGLSRVSVCRGCLECPVHLPTSQKLGKHVVTVLRSFWGFGELKVRLLKMGGLIEISAFVDGEFCKNFPVYWRHCQYLVFFFFFFFFLKFMFNELI